MTAKTRLTAWVLAGVLLVASHVRAGTLEDTLTKIENDLSFLLVDGPVYLSSRLPVMASGADLLTSMELASFRNFSFGISLTTGVLTSFDRLDDNFQLVPRKFPSAAPMPMINFVARMGVLPRFDLGVKVSFFPEINTKYSDIIMAAGMLNVALQARYHLLRGKGGVPDLVTQAGFSFFSGFLKVGKDYTFNFDETINGTNVAGSFSMAGSPILGWTIFQISPSIVARWNFGWFHPYVGTGIDLTFGHIDGGFDMEISLTITSPTQESGKEKVVSTVTSMAPRAFGVRPVIGMEFDLTKRLKLVLQADLGFYVRQHPGDLSNPGLEASARKEAPQSLYVQTIDGEPLFPVVFAGGLGVRYDYH